VGTVVVDTSVLLGLLDPQDCLHLSSAGAARAHRDSGDAFVLPASVLAEALVGVARTDQAAVELRSRMIVEAFGPVFAADEHVAVAAALRRARHKDLRFPDALVLATADVTNADFVLTGDRGWRRLDRRVRVVPGNP
jgi:predicted nucleic acid-binding protein